MRLGDAHLAIAAETPHRAAMRTTSNAVSVRLYHLDDADGGAAVTLVYAPLDEALRIAAAQPAEIQPGLYLQTDNDVIGYLDLIGE